MHSDFSLKINRDTYCTCHSGGIGWLAADGTVYQTLSIEFPSPVFFWHVLCVFVPFFLSFFFGEVKSQLPGFELMSQRVRRFRGYQLSYQGDRLHMGFSPRLQVYVCMVITALMFLYNGSTG